MTGERIADKQLRSFGLTVGGIFAAIGAWPLVFRSQPVRIWAVALGVALIIPAIVAPGVLKWPHRFWLQVGHILGWINSRVIMTGVFYLIFTPVGFFRRMAADPLNRKLDPDCASYRTGRVSRAASHMKHQY